MIMTNPEILNAFNEKREEFRPYGLTCEVWTPNLMLRPDRHNEIELNYFPEGSMTYLFRDRRITIPPERLVLFWGLIPHQIVHYEGAAPYYVCTIPISQFLAWKLPGSLVDKILKGEIVIEESNRYSSYDKPMMEKWVDDINHPNTIDALLLEMNARLLRMSVGIQSRKENASTLGYEFDLAEQMAIYIAQNYLKPINVSDVGKAVNLHPDYANSIFKRIFSYTLYEYIIQERIAHAQRKLILSDSSVTGIAFDSGFNSISRFNAAFLNINGCTPREYRKRCR